MKKIKVLILILSLVLVTSLAYAQRITVTRPNGGENWVIGESEPINWTATEITGGTFKVAVYRDSGATFVGVIQDRIPITARSIRWEVGRLASGRVIDPRADYRIKIRHTGFTSNDFSNGDFTLSTASAPPPPPERTITVSTPNGGEPWPKGGIRSITWTSSGITSGRYKITLYRGTAIQGPITENIPHPTMTYSWNPVGTLSDGTVVPYATNYKVKVELMGASVEDMSDSGFSIIRTATAPREMREAVLPRMVTPVPRIIAPNGGESIRRVENYEVRWTAYDGFGTHPRIKLMKDGRVVKEYPPSRVWTLVTRGIYKWSWVFTSDIPSGGNYKLRIEKGDNPRSFDESDGPFSIVGGPDLTLTEPRGGNLVITHRKNIKWNASEIRGNLGIKLKVERTGRLFTIADNVPATSGLYRWDVGVLQGESTRLITSGNYRILIRKMDGSISAESNLITIQRPTISISSPNGGTYRIDDNLPIRCSTSRDFRGNIKVIIQQQTYGDHGRDYYTVYTGFRKTIDWRIFHTPGGAGELDYIPVNRNYRIVIQSVTCPLEIAPAEGDWFLLKNK